MRLAKLASSALCVITAFAPRALRVGGGCRVQTAISAAIPARVHTVLSRVRSLGDLKLNFDGEIRCLVCVGASFGWIVLVCAGSGFARGVIVGV